MDSDQEKFSGTASGASPLSAVTISCALGERRTMQIAVNLCFSDPVELQNQTLDNAMHLCDRQQARYDLEQLEINFRQVGLNTRNMLAGLRTADCALEAQVATLTATLEGQQEARQSIYDEGYTAHTKSNKRGAYEPGGFIKNRLQGADIEIAKTKAALEAAPRDAEQHRGNLIASLQRNQTDLRERREKINQSRTIAGLPLNDEYSEEENAKV